MVHLALLRLMLEAITTDIVSPSPSSAPPKILSEPQDRRPITPLTVGKQHGTHVRFGSERTFCGVRPMSALLPKADIGGTIQPTLCFVACHTQVRAPQPTSGGTAKRP